MKKARILIVDDEVTFAKMLRFNLEAVAGYEVDCENSSTRVVDHALEFQPDLILLDIVMPGLDGGTLKHQLESHPRLRQIPIIFVTALVSKEDAAGGLFVESGGHSMLPKPVELSHLIQAIESKLANPSPANSLSRPQDP